MADFERIAVLGLGLLGGSVALATKRAGVATRTAGATRNPDVLAEAFRRGVVDEVGTFEEVVRGADLVVLATTVAAMPVVLRRVAPHLREGVIVTDVGSVKGVLAETMPGLLPSGARWIGSHPMAGSHERGLAFASADLFEGAPCIVTEDADGASVDRVCEFWRALGARVLRRDATTHDVEVAWSSHVPHALAYAYASALASAPAGAREVVGSGFRDFTRIARSSPELWGDILTANRKSIAAPLVAVGDALSSLGEAIEAGDATKVAILIEAAQESLALYSPSEED